MREHKSETHDPTPWHVPVAVEDVAETGQHFDLVADAQVRAGVARLAELRDLPRLEANFEVTRQGAGGLRVAGVVSATVGQTCVVTLEPLANEVEEAVDLLVLPPPVAGVAGAAGAAPRDESAGDSAAETEPLVGGRIDLGALATEFLILGLNRHPRKPGAVFQPPQDLAAEEGPFAALARLKKRRDGR